MLFDLNNAPYLFSFLISALGQIANAKFLEKKYSEYFV